MKIETQKKLQKKINLLKKRNKKIVLCHGVFDLVHLGHIKHFKSAKTYGDYLIVSLTSDRYIKKGPNRPLFNQNQRLEFLKEIKIIDEVFISDHESAVNSINLIKPNFFIKGPDYRNNSNDKTKKIILEKKAVKKNGGIIKYTNDETFSSSKIINVSGFVLNEEQRKFINRLKEKYSYSDIENLISKFKYLKVCVIGELIIDKYCFGNVIGKSGKEPYLVLKESRVEDYVGGAGAIARHLSSFVNSIKIISLFGNELAYKKLITKSFPKNIKKFFLKPYDNFQTIVKTRFVDQPSNYKLFGNYILSENINLSYENKIINIIKKIKKGIDLFIISDYGHHFITPKIIEKIRKTEKLSLINTQINAANIGYHTINKYLDFSSAIINETELRQELRDNSTDIRILVKKFIKRNKFKNMIITRGKNGALFVNHKFDIFECPAFAIRSIDKVGAGDAMLSIASLGIKLNLHPDLILFLGSIAAAISVESIGNKEHVSLEKIDRIVEYIFK